MIEQNERNKAKGEMEIRCLALMGEHEFFCDDNTHLLVSYIVEQDYGVTITPEIISKMRSIDRTRQRLLKKYPEMDRRTRGFQLERNDRNYERERNKE